MGAKQTFHRDAFGRDTLRIVQSGPTTRTRYDAMGRDTAVITHAPRTDPTSYVAGNRDTLHVSTTYNVSGQPLELRRRVHPNPANLSLQDSWTYDRLGRVTEERLAFSPESYVYDEAGNVIRRRPRGCSASSCEIVTEYDGLNRPTRVIVPARSYGGLHPRFPLDPLASDSVTIRADTLTFAYNERGMTRANNREAQIHRSYYSDGSLRRDSVRIRNLGSQSFSSWYVTQFGYDLAGRPDTIIYPSATGATVPVVYAWNNTHGTLASVRDVSGTLYSFSYDYAGNIQTAGMPGHTETRSYNARSELTGRSGALRSATFGLDSQGRLIQQTGQSTFFGNYFGLGSVAKTRGQTYEVQPPVGYPPNSIVMEDWSSADALGNVIYSEQVNSITDGMGLDPVLHTFNSYSSSSGRMMQTVSGDTVRNPGMPPPYNVIGFAASSQAYFSYDLAGNRTHVSRTARYDPRTEPGLELIFDYEVRENTQMYYDWQGQLRVVDQRKGLFKWNWPSGPHQPVNWQSTTAYEYERGAVFEEFRYDALGRRVIARGRPDTQCTTRCRPYYDTFLWNGSQIMHEIRREHPTSGSTTGLYNGKVTYTHGAGIDVPVSVLRLDEGSPYSVALHANRKGVLDMGTLMNGTRVDPTKHEWAGLSGPQYPRHLSIFSYQNAYVNAWLGSLVTNKKDGSGLVYMRNRYYDPISGQFTQIDPIGPAGGLNLYGYAGGDPINFSDPFGLCPPEDEDDGPHCAVVSLGATVSGKLGSGGGLSFGLMGSIDEGLGVYVRPSVGAGIGARAGMEVGFARTRAAFDGGALHGCVGFGPADACFGGGPAGKSGSLAAGVGISELGPLSTDVQFSHTRSYTMKDAGRYLTRMVSEARAAIYDAAGVPRFAW